jgi:hypothetical protein
MESMTSPLAALQRPHAYRVGREHVFPSAGSLDWYTRTHRDKLHRAGALVKVGGVWYVHAPRFDAFLLSGGRVAAELDQAQAA